MARVGQHVALIQTREQCRLGRVRRWAWGPVRTSCGRGTPSQGIREQVQALPAGLPVPPHEAASGGMPCLLALPGPQKQTYFLPHLSALGREGVPALQEVARRVTVSLCVHFCAQVFTKDGLGREVRLCPLCAWAAPGPSPRCPLPEGLSDEMGFLAVDLPVCGILLGRILTWFPVLVSCCSHDEAGALGRGLPVEPEASPCLMAALPWFLSQFCLQGIL